MNSRKRFLVFVAAPITMLVLLISCVPVEETANPSGYVLSTPLMPSTESTQSPDPTPSPTAQVLSVETLNPTTGSVLKWVDESNFIYIPSGNYQIGADPSLSTPHLPAQQVSLDEFWIQQNEVTNQQYARCVEVGFCSSPGQQASAAFIDRDPYTWNDPVVRVTWYQAQEFCLFLGGRLPTEAEWEAAARGTRSSIYPWGNNPPSCDLANYEECHTPPSLEPVGRFETGTNDLGLQDMAGNVNEWVSDWYAAEFTGGETSNPAGAESGTLKVFRGGAFDSGIDEITALSRFWLEPVENAANLGFRCVLTANSTLPNHAQACEVPALSVKTDALPTSTPFPCAPAAVSAKCELQGSTAVNSILIHQNGCLWNPLHSLSAGSEILSCTRSANPDGTLEYTCSYPDMHQGETAALSFCHPVLLQNLSQTCPFGYQFSQENGFCEKANLSQVSSACPEDTLSVEPYGCLPIQDASTGGCPIGSFTAVVSVSTVCVPYGFDPESSLPSAQSNSCPSGQVYDPDRTCCTTKENPSTWCSPGFQYLADLRACVDIDYLPENCQQETITLAYCQMILRNTPTPTFKPTLDDETSPDSPHSQASTPSPTNTPVVCRREWNPDSLGWEYICD